MLAKHRSVRGKRNAPRGEKKRERKERKKKEEEKEEEEREEKGGNRVAR